MFQVFVFFYPESTVAFTQTIQPFVLVYFRFIGMYVCAQRLLLSVCMQEKTLNNNNIQQLYLKGRTCDFFFPSVFVCRTNLYTVVNKDAFVDLI